jgi:molybdopterin converting factor subunit 1
MTVHILYFGVLSQVMNNNSQSIQLPENSTIQELLDILITENSLVKNYKFQIAVNKQIVTSEVIIKEGDEIALLPPFSGG